MEQMFRINICAKLMGNEPFTVSFLGKPSEWENLESDHIDNGVITIPPHMFDHERAVEDELSYIWREGRLCAEIPHGRTEPERGCIFLIAESPHKDEYDSNHWPIRPLNNPHTRSNIEKYLPDFIRAAEKALKTEFCETDIVLGNPIQYQASLQSLMKDPRSGIQSSIRDSVWKALFSDSRFVKNFSDRIEKYNPSLLILTPTANIRDDLLLFANRLGRNILYIDRHPSMWHTEAQEGFVAAASDQTEG